MSDFEHKLGELLIKKQMTLATAESCTGGLIAHKITNIPGSSQYFECGLVTYSNDSKIDQLKVPTETIIEFGAVSVQTARAMALGVRELARTDLGLAVTGVAGPTGGTPEKPVGLVFIAVTKPDHVAHMEIDVEVQEHRFSGARMDIKQQTADTALKIILDILENKL